MNRVFVISDTHFGHRLMARVRPWSTIEEHDAELIQRWNSVVKPDDIVYHLGDVCLGGPQNIQLIDKCNGSKRLVMGNHDTYPMERYLAVFSKVYGYIEKGGCILSHMPVHPGQQYRYRKNIHGHTHEMTLANDWYVNVSCENVDYTPVLLDSLIERRRLSETT